ncbi:hypothetical protein OS493_008664 [Desmophyllum pertusum]|uniref:Uncharacterized protein n=1 Tax=Desmophyllum pertusum TaxID=174260 RepID=A0A9W9ZT29_9CNID|nr:hypothetical protein OS493_008664 [Desmophyllum pertusum]
MSIALNFVVALLTLATSTQAADNEVITSLIQAYSTEGAESQSYFSSHGKAMFEQVSMLDSMALAKVGKGLEASDQLASLAMQSILADLPLEYQAAGGLLKLMQSDRSLFKDTIVAVTEELGHDTARQNIFDAWKADFERLQQLAETSKPSPKKVRVWHVYGKAKFFVKRLNFPPKLRIGPVSDILGIVVSGMGLYDAIKNKKHHGDAPLIVQLFWPTSLALETANKLTEISRNDLQGYQHQLEKFTESGARSFGWMYQVNSGVLVERMIQPNTPIKFSQPSCTTPGTTPCDPKTTDYKEKRYLALGRQRKSTYTKHEFKLDFPYDFLGIPTESKFCGNTINVNTVSFRQYIEFLGRKYRSDRGRLVGNYQRNVEIDTRTVPQYNDVDLNQWRAKDQSVKRGRERSQLDETQDIKCEPDSDRISIDELAQLSPQNGKGNNQHWRW